QGISLKNKMVGQVKNQNVVNNNTYILLALAASLPVIMPNIQYFDDLARTVAGYYAWSSDGRPIVDIFYNFVSGGDRVVDLYPYSQIFAYILLGWCCYSLAKVFNTESKYGIIMTAPIIFSPMLLGNMLFRYDAITMALSISMCVFAAGLDATKPKKMVILSTILIGASMLTYQAALSVYIVICIFAYIQKIYEGIPFKKILQIMLLNSISTALGFLIYKIVTMSFVTMSKTALARSSLIKFNNDTYNHLLDASAKSLNMMFGTLDKLIILAIIASILIGIIFKLKNSSSIKRWVLESLLVAVLIASAIVCSFVMVAVASMPAIYPRSFMSFGFLIFGLLWIVYVTGLKKVSLTLSIIVVVSFISVNSLSMKAVTTIENVQSQAAKSIVSHLNAVDEKFTDVVVSSDMKAPQDVMEIYKKHDFIIRIIWMHFNNQFASYWLTYNGYPIRKAPSKIVKDVNDNKDAWSMISSNTSYSLYRYKQTAVVEFK
ncbi:hypothetical protein EKN39_23900, partial [Enterobacter hormaechei]